MPRRGFVYILASRRNGTLYIGVTSNLLRRIWEHRHHLVEGFTRRYGVDALVYYEVFDNVPDAILREKQLKKWNRAWKLRLIESVNPKWCDLYDELCTHPYMQSLSLDAEIPPARQRGEASAGPCFSNPQSPFPVIPAKAGIQRNAAPLDSGFPPSRE